MSFAVHTLAMERQLRWGSFPTLIEFQGLLDFLFHRIIARDNPAIME